MSSNLATSLDATSKQVDLKLTTMLEQRVVHSNVVEGLIVRGVNESDYVELPKTYTCEIIPIDRDLIPRPETTRTWPHLTDVAKEIHLYDKNIEVGLLIGFNCSAALMPHKVVAAGKNDPYAVI